MLIQKLTLIGELFVVQLKFTSNDCFRIDPNQIFYYPYQIIRHQIENFHFNNILFYKMSNSSYCQKWEECINDILEQVEEQNLPLEENKNDKGITYKRSDIEWFHFYAGLYIRYIHTYRKLEDCYDQLVHPQKRKLLREMLDNTMVRMCEVKQNLIKYSTQGMVIQSDFINLGEIVMNLKLTPKFLEIPMPRYFKDQQKKQVEDRNKFIQQKMMEFHGTNLPEQEQFVENFVLESGMDTVIRLIQKLQRGRQGILRGLQSVKIRAKFLKEKNTQIAEINVDEQDTKRATIIQKFWRAFSSRKLLHELREDQINFLGMKKEQINVENQSLQEKQRAKMKIIQKNHQESYLQDHSKIRNEVKSTQQYTMKATMLDQRRKWIQKFLQMHQFCDVPKDVQQFYQKDLVDDNKQNKQNAKGKKNAAPKKDVKKTKKNDLDKFLQQHDKNGPSQRILNLQKQIEEHTNKWGGRDESKNFDQKYDSEMARSQIRPSVQEEIRLKVDEMIALELDNMRIKYGLKKKKQKKKAKANKKQKKVKIPLGLNKRDPLQLLSELVQNKIVKILKPAKITDFLGDFSPLVDERQYQLMPDPSMAQIRQVIVQNIAIPLGSQFAKDNLEKSNWFMFYGPMGTGKTLVVRALQNQCNTILFDLSPSNIEEKYPDKASLKKLIWTVILLAKQYQPSIVLFQQFEQIFTNAKKKKGTQPNFAPKMKKAVVDMKKNKYWLKTDQVCVIGCSSKPYEAPVKDYVKLFDKKFYFPYPDYATRKLLIQTFVKDKMGKLPSYLNYNTIAHVTEGFTAGSFKQCINKVLTQARIKRQPDDPLHLMQFVQPLSNTVCTFAQQYQKFKIFTDEVTGLKERRELKLKPQGEEKRSKKK